MGNVMERPMQRPWLKHYPPGVPAEIDPSQYPSLVAMFEESFQAHRGKDAFVCMGKALTYGEVDESSRAFAAWLQSKGLERGARVAIMLPNVLQNPVAMAGILRAGMTVVNVNPLYTPRELEYQLNDSGAEAIVVLENFAQACCSRRCRKRASSMSWSPAWATCWASEGHAGQSGGAARQEDGAALRAAERDRVQ